MHTHTYILCHLPSPTVYHSILSLVTHILSHSHIYNPTISSWVEPKGGEYLLCSHTIQWGEAQTPSFNSFLMSFIIMSLCLPRTLCFCNYIFSLFNCTTVLLLCIFLHSPKTSNEYSYRGWIRRDSQYIFLTFLFFRTCFPTIPSFFRHHQWKRQRVMCKGFILCVLQDLLACFRVHSSPFSRSWSTVWWTELSQACLCSVTYLAREAFFCSLLCGEATEFVV